MFGEYIKRKRNEQRKSLRDVSDNLEFSHSYLSRIENSKRGVIHPRHWGDLIEAIPSIDHHKLDLYHKADRGIEIQPEDLPDDGIEFLIELKHKIESEELSDSDYESLKGYLLHITQ